MPWKEFSIKFVTPTFLDDPYARPHRPNETISHVPFPVASLRGVLRYWLRAVIGAQVGNNLTHLSLIETAVFGTASGRDGTPSPVRLRARDRVRLDNTPPDWLQGSQDDIELDRANVKYLLGQGLYHAGTDRLQRRYVPDGDTVDLAVNTTAGREVATLFQTALWCLNTYGGIGARTRRGFGTIAVTPPNLASDFDNDRFSAASIHDLPDVLEWGGHAARTILRELSPQARPGPPVDRPTYPALANGWYQHRDESLDSTESVADALAVTGSLLRHHRLGGNTLTAEYMSIVAPYLDGATPPARPFRLGAFGLPIPFTDSHGDGQGSAAMRRAVVEPVIDHVAVRRASPLWLRVYQDDGVWYLRSLATLNEWLPNSATLRISRTDSSDRNRKPLTRPHQAEIDAELRGWFTGTRPTAAPATTPTEPTPPDATSRPAEPRPGPPPRPPRPGPPPGRR